jgi:hypothetical protein
MGVSAELITVVLLTRDHRLGADLGAVTMVTRKGRVAHFEAQGLMDEPKAATRKDAIFRMASMSKPVAGVAILMLNGPNGEMSERLKEHAWKLLWQFAMACCRFRLPLRSQPLNSDRVTSINRCKPR